MVDFEGLTDVRPSSRGIPGRVPAARPGPAGGVSVVFCRSHSMSSSDWLTAVCCADPIDQFIITCVENQVALPATQWRSHS